MGTISSNVGLVTGFPIASTVSALMALEAKPVNNLTAANTTLQNQETAYTQLAAYLTALQSTTNALGQSSLYTQTSLTSSNPAALSATATGTPTVGNYSFTPLQLAQAQQLQSSTFASDTSPIGAGTLSFGYGGSLDNPVNLDLLNGGAGFSRGKIQITDRSGATATVDLTGAQTIDDVINDINSNSGIHVTAQAVGNHLQLTDTSGGSASNLKVQEVGGGTAAASLGLAGINTSSTQAEGQNILSLFSALPTSVLADGNGVQFDQYLPDVQVQLSDGSSVDVTLHKQPVTGTFAQATTTAANGVNASLQFTAKQAGAASAGVTITYVEDPSITAGQETVNYNATNKTLTFGIDQGATTANDIIAALNADPTASAAFSAQAAPGGNGSGLVTISDAGVTAGPQSTATTPGTLGSNSALKFTAVSGGSNFDGVNIQFVNNPSITAGNETVAYDASNPSDKTLTFQIAAGSTTASDIVAALQRDPTASQLFTASLPTGDNGSGLVSTSDSAVTSGGALIEPVPVGAPTTLGDVINAFNAADPGKLQAQIAPDGQGIELTDLSGGGGAFTISDINGSLAAQNLGLTASPASGNTITGAPLLAGLNSVLLSDLKGGSGIGTLGTLDLTDRNNVSASVDLSGAHTVADVLQLINGAGIGITASLNSAGDGILLTDTTGSTAHNLVVADGDSADTAEKLGLAVNAATNTQDSGSLQLQTVSENTTLASFNGGSGVGLGSFKIVDSSGKSATINVNSQITTIGDLMQAINGAGIGVHAQINAAGNGIELLDTAGGSGTLQLSATGGTSAQDLHLLSPATTQTINSQPTQVIDGSTATTINISSTDTLQSLIAKINAAGAGVTASEVNDGSLIDPYWFTLTAQNSGQRGELTFDTSQAPLTLQQTVVGQDALMYVGTAGQGGYLASSPTNSFTNPLSGATITANSVSTTPVNLNVAQSSSSLTAAVQAFVDGYNQIESALGSDTSYNTTTNTGAVLQGDANALSVQTQLSNLASGQITGAGSITSLAQLGITINQDGTLSLNTSALQSEVSSNPQAVRQFFTTANAGLSARFNSLVNQLAGPNQSVLTNATNSLKAQITNNTTRINQLNTQINADSARLTAQFDQAELIVSQLQSNASALTSIQGFATIGGQVAGSTSLDSGSTSSSGSSGANSNSSNLGSAFG